MLLQHVERNTRVMTATMRTYSFSLTSPSGLEQLYRIGQFPDAERALCLAELIASELSIGENGPYYGWTIEVRDCEGSPVSSSPLGEGDGLGMTNVAFAESHPKQLEFTH